ncbi:MULTISPECIES: DUF3999 domain-containing protein [unclassified Pseudomonas]|uniref:DUF3999 domain-containing protein n=1 Tax=unclassified Pseudomonas TaxID=196821 RepID=UPI00244A334E|nr:MULTISPECIES: DUF3999 domain-containing protein [unclassified Pseudomonas]MDH0896323.1 DUF3999 domain-containing protein [Pseudomonas sp. GD03875]MDH1066083.1 DUF3999 domain-containing protein [Pseudomonas sp. GD03985]
MNKSILCLLALLATPWLQAAQTTQVPLRLEGEGPWYRLEVPFGLQLAASHADLRDLRVLNAEGEELAYALTLGSARPEERRVEAAVKWFPLRGPADAPAAPAIRVQRGTTGTLVEVAPESAGEGEQVLRGWLLDASAFDQPLHRLRLDWSTEQEGFQRFSIEASDDLQHWRPWDDGQIARLSFADERVEQREVPLPGAKARYLRLLWQAPRQAPALLDARLVSVERRDQGPALAWSAPLVPASAKAGEYSWELPLALPLKRIRVELPAGNVLAPVSLAARRAGTLEWQPLAAGLLYRLPENGKESLHDEIELPSVPVQQLRLRVDARGGGLGQEAPALRVALNGTQVVFLARGSEPYRLAVGDASARSAALPLGTLIPGYEPGRLASLGTAIAPDTAPAPERATASQPAYDWQRLGLWGVLLAGVALLGGMAFSLLRKPESGDR